MFHKIVRPMLLKEVDHPFRDSNYLYELKYDGIRALIYVSNKEFKIVTRNGNDVAKLYPELKLMQKLVNGHEVIFDGELVAFKNGKPDFHQLLSRNQLKNSFKIEQMMEEVPVYFIAFDILYFDRDLTKFNLLERKEILNKFKDTNVFMKTKTYQDGVKLFSHIKKLGLEGIIAKEKNSFYSPNTRTSSWLKIKNFKKGYFYVHGYVKLKDKYRLLLGEYRKETFYFVGNVSVPKDNLVLQHVLKQKNVKNRFINYDDEANYVIPKYKILVSYMERTESGLRQPFVKKD